MGKGSNVQKAQQARERNAKKAGKSDEERKAASMKAAKDSAAKKCLLCLQTFMISARESQLHLHITAKHPDVTDFTQCFPELAGWDPNDPKGERAAAAAKAEEQKAKAKAKKAAGGADLDALLDAGLTKKKK